MDVESLQQIAGDYRTYRSIEEIDKLIPDIAQKLAVSVTRNTSGLPGLSVPPFNILTGVNQNDAMVLAQILACDLANGNKFAVLPRTDNIDKVLEEHRRQRSGITNQERVKLLGVGRNAQYVLSGSVQRLGTLNKFAADVLDIVDGSTKDGYEETYSDFSQGFELIPKLAAQLMWGMSLIEIKESVAGNYYITLTKDTIINNSIDFIGFEKKIITIQGDVYNRRINFANDSSFSIPNDVVLILKNIVLIGNSLFARSSVIRVNKGGRLEMQNNSVIRDNLSRSGGGGVFIDGGTFIMNGGMISGNTSSFSLGGGVCIFDGTFIMNEGMISDNLSSGRLTGVGGGVYISGGTFTMNGGIIDNNKAIGLGDAGEGGGVFINGGTFIMNDGTISSNSAYSEGGGVCIYGGTFTMNGGMISSNKTNGIGGGIYFLTGTFVKRRGRGTISGTNYAKDGIVVGGIVKRNKEAGAMVSLDSRFREGWE